jgi:hypothetical protein
MKTLNRRDDFWILIAMAAAIWSTQSFAAFQELEDGSKVIESSRIPSEEKQIENIDENIDKDGQTALATDTAEMPVLNGNNKLRFEPRTITYPSNNQWATNWAIDANECLVNYLQNKAKSPLEIGRFWLKVKAIQYEVKNYERSFSRNDSWNPLNWDHGYESDESLMRKMKEGASVTFDRKTGRLIVKVAPILNHVGYICQQVAVSGLYKAVDSLVSGPKLPEVSHDVVIPIEAKKKQENTKKYDAAARFRILSDRLIPAESIIETPKVSELATKELKPEEIRTQGQFSKSAIAGQ